MYKKEAIEKMVEEVLDGTDLKLKVDGYRMEESLEDGNVIVHCEVHHQQTGEKKIIEGKGVGVVDAFFHGVVELYSGEFPSLTTIRFSDFAIKANLDTGRDQALTDSVAEVTLRVENSEKHEYAFSHVSPSITRSSIECVLSAAEFFMNCERAFIAVYRALQHAKAENRPDSVARYTGQLSTLVEATSYSEVIEQIKQELKNG